MIVQLWVPSSYFPSPYYHLLIDQAEKLSSTPPLLEDKDAYLDSTKAKD
jgi:hypothetical protein